VENGLDELSDPREDAPPEVSIEFLAKHPETGEPVERETLKNSPHDPDDAGGVMVLHISGENDSREG